MRRMTSLAILVLAFAAGCTGGGDDPAAEGSVEAEETTAEAAPTAPAELALTVPDGFTEVAGEDREVLFTENHVSHVFAVAGGEGTQDRIIVTSYLLAEGVDTSTYDSQATIVTDYFRQLNSTISINNFYPTIVHRQNGIYRFGTIETGDGELDWQDHFLFDGRYLINITCQWDAHYAQIVSACEELTASFPFPEGWSSAFDAA